MDITTILEKLNYDSANIAQEIEYIRDEMRKLEEALYIKDNQNNNIQITISTLKSMKKENDDKYDYNTYPSLAAIYKKDNYASELSVNRVKRIKNKIKKIPVKEIEISNNINFTLKEKIINCLQESTNPMLPKEIYELIKTPDDEHNLLHSIYGTLGNNKHIFIKEDKKWSLRQHSENPKTISGIKQFSIKEHVIRILSKNKDPMTPKEIYDSIEDKTISKNLISALYVTLGENKKIFKKDPITKKWYLLSKENEELWTNL
jgi:Fe2+ or Zn2+ uptake regulation protein